MKKNLTSWIGSGILVFGMIACGNESPKESETDTQEPIEETTAETGDHLQTGSPEISDPVIGSYLNIKNALVATDLEATVRAAQKMSTILVEEGDSTLLFHANAIGEAANIDAARIQFEGLSEGVYEHAKSKNDLEVTLYKEFCPMAFDGKGAYWLSAEKEIRNPYFGDKMLKCGTVQETIE